MEKTSPERRETIYEGVVSVFYAYKLFWGGAMGGGTSTADEQSLGTVDSGIFTVHVRVLQYSDVGSTFKGEIPRRFHNLSYVDEEICAIYLLVMPNLVGTAYIFRIGSGLLLRSWRQVSNIGSIQ